ncbi:MAG: ABC transporter permease [Dethiobacteria bacterium]|jgi:ABC-2 type transport system permease protein
MLHDTYTVFWREMVLLRKKFKSFFAGSMVSPLLYLLSFGWGLGRNIQLDSTSYLDFVVPGIVALSAMNASYSGTGTSLNVSRLYYKTLEEFLVAPISVVSLVLGNVFSGCFRGLFSAGLIIIFSYFFGANLCLSGWFFVSLLLTCFLFATLGLVAAMIVSSHEGMSRFGTFVILPMTFLCGTFFKVENYPGIIAWFVKMLPLTHSSISLRALAMNTEFPLVSLLVMTAYALILFILGVWVTYRVE